MRLSTRHNPPLAHWLLKRTTDRFFVRMRNLVPSRAVILFRAKSGKSSVFYPAIGMVIAMTTPEGVTPGNWLADDEPASCEYPRIIRIRTVAMRALPKRTLFAILAKPSPDDEDA
jgi:hypothetical protein